MELISFVYMIKSSMYKQYKQPTGTDWPLDGALVHAQTGKTFRIPPVAGPGSIYGP